LHAALANRAHCPEIALREEQAEAYAKAAATVARYHQDILPVLSPYQKAWLGLAMVAGPIYIDIGRAIAARRAATPRVSAPHAGQTTGLEEKEPDLNELLHRSLNGGEQPNA
jgi:hypothetical protein